MDDSSGPISAEDALIRSRNIPAVWVATQIKQPDLYQFLQNAGVSRLLSEEHYGLSLVLGGGEITMEELTGLYADMLKLFREAGMPRRIPPPLPDCISQQTGELPVISSPVRAVSYSLHRRKPEEVIHLEAAVAADVHSVFWFDGRSLIGNVPVTDGIHLIRIVDDQGRGSEREVEVELLP
jgi:membrane carboxypeptidase/penicillin-binding protein